MLLERLLGMYIDALYHNTYFLLMGIAIVGDALLGFMRSIYARKIVSSVGINGLIRKATMVFIVSGLTLADVIGGVDVLFFLPDTIKKFLLLEKLGFGEFFSLLFIMYESLSVLKNMALLDLPVPGKMHGVLRDLLKNMTGELDNKSSK